MDIEVLVSMDRFGNLQVYYGDKDLYIQDESSIEEFLNSVLPLTYHTEYTGKKSAKNANKELKQDIEDGYNTKVLISSLYFEDD